jgi:glycosyltransferase involved in cell wall biosynthesis
MRVLYLVHQFMPEFAGGTEKVTLNLARATQGDGHHAEIATVSVNAGRDWRPGPDGVRSTTVEGVPVHVLDPAGQDQISLLGFAANGSQAAQFRRFLDSRPDFDVVHVMHAFRLVDAVEVLAARRIPYVMTLTDFFAICHRFNLLRLDMDVCDGPNGGAACQAHCAAPEIAEPTYAERTGRLAALLGAASAVAAVSDYVAERVRAEHPGLKVLVVENGVDLAGFGPPAARPKDRPLTFGYLGTVSEAKGAALLVAAFVRAAPTAARLSIVGPSYEPELAARLAAMARGHDVAFEGPVAGDRVSETLGGFDVLCVPSQVPEAFSLSLHEGFAAGLPALVSDLGNQARAVRAAGCGLAIPASDEAAWAKAIAAIAAEPAQLEAWRARLPLPTRVEEEAFFYGQLYRGAAGLRHALPGLALNEA